MKILVDSIQPVKKKTDVLCGFVLEKTNQIIGLSNVDTKINQALKDSINEIEGKFAKIAIINTMGNIPARRIMIVGLGDKQKITNDSIRFVSGKIAKTVRELNLSDFSIIVPNNQYFDPISSVSQIVEGTKLALYSFDDFKKTKTKKSPNLSILVSNSAKITKAVQIAEKISDGVIFTKSLANLPPNECAPDTLAKFAKNLANKTKIRTKIFEKPYLKKNGFGGITAVGQGSKNEPRLIIMEYYGTTKSIKPIVIVGKAVTFDTGGISLKPSEKMDEMKFDKCGGCTVFGIMKAVENLKLPLNVIGIVPSVENMPGGES